MLKIKEGKNWLKTEIKTIIANEKLLRDERRTEWNNRKKE